MKVGSEKSLAIAKVFVQLFDLLSRNFLRPLINDETKLWNGIRHLPALLQLRNEPKHQICVHLVVGFIDQGEPSHFRHLLTRLPSDLINSDVRIVFVTDPGKDRNAFRCLDF